MTALILKSNAWHLIEELPEEPKRDYINHDISTREFIFKINYDKYRASLKAAISNAVRVENQGVAESIYISRFEKSKQYPDFPEEGKAYPVEVSYEIIDECKFNRDYHTCKDVINDFSCFNKASCQARKFARLLPCKEEGRETKPDFRDMAIRNAPVVGEKWYEAGCERIWTEYVEPLRAEIERLKEGK